VIIIQITFTSKLRFE